MATLAVKTGSLAGRRLTVERELTLGRYGADVELDDHAVSRRHAIVRRVGDELEVEDLGSRNGTWVNGTRVLQPTLLAAGDLLELGTTLIAAELPPASIALHAPARAPQRIDVSSELVIGRAGEGIAVDDEKLSRRHAAIRPVADALEIEDLGSTNGTWVNSARIERATRLRPGDVIQLGETTLTVDTGRGPPRPRETAAAEIVWETFGGKGVFVYAPAGSYAATLAPAELAEAEKALAALAELLRPQEEVGAVPFTIYLSDGFSDLGADGTVADSADGLPGGVRAIGELAVVRVVQPESPGEPVTWAVTKLAVAHWLGATAGTEPAIISGLAGLVAARIGAAPPVEEMRAAVRAALEGGQAISIFADREDAGPDAAATAFVAFLLDTRGPEPLRRFLAEYDPDRRDAAATAAYARPLGALEEAWLASLHRPEGRRAAFRKLVRTLGPLMRPYLLRWVEIAIYMVLAIAFTLAIPFAFKYLFDHILPDGRTGPLVVFVLVLFGAFIFNTLAETRRAYVSGAVSHGLLFGLQGVMFERLQRLPQAFYARAKVGDLMSRLSEDLRSVQQAMDAVFTEGVFLTVQAVGAAVAALVLSPLLGGLVLVVVPLFVVSYGLLQNRVRQASRTAQAKFGEVHAAAQENLSAQHVVKAFRLEEHAIATYRVRLDELLQSILRVIVLGSLFNASVGMAITLGELLVIGVGGYLVIHGDVTLGTLVAFVGLMPTLFQPMTTLATVGQTVQAASGAIDRVNEILDEPLQIEDRADAGTLPALAGELRFEDVHFAYEPGRPVLRGLDLTIPAGIHAAIVGPSGSGKSTVVNLLLRFWDADSGRVLFDGIDIRDGTIASLRDQIGLVFQDTFVFDTTLRENIAISRPDASDADVAAAAHAAQLESYIGSLPARYDTVLGERGVRMSGGQRQRLAIARALIRDPAILVLDEATSALDAHTEREILDTLASVTAGRTTISITHRLSLAAMADRIFVLDEGQLVETGSHDALVSAGGPYQGLYEEQMGYAPATRAPRVAAEVARLRAVPLLARLPGDELAELAASLRIERFAAGEDVVKQGDNGDKLYVVSSGQLEVVTVESGRERTVNLLKDGDFFGEMALVADDPRAATVRTATSAELYSLARADFQALLHSDADLARMVAATVAARRAAVANATLNGTMLRPALKGASEPAAAR